jgi:hypothetical protein
MSSSPRVARAATPARPVSSSSLPTRILAGAIGGLAGGLVFGVLMAMTGMLPAIASMVGSSSAAVGFGVHLVISVLIGWGLTVLFGNLLLTGYGRGAVVGLAYGAVWWVLGGLLMMPLMLGMPLFTFDTTAWMSLMGHLIYGLVLGLTATAVLHRHR